MIKKIVKRWKSETPAAWQKVRSAALVISATSMAIWGANTSLGLSLDPAVLAVCKYSILSGLILSAGAQLQKTPDEKI